LTHSPTSPRRVAIIGGGLAGTMLALRLLEKGIHVTLIDAPKENSASRVAAGIYNVITGRHMNLTWRAEILIREMNAFFSDPAFADLAAFRHPMPIYFPFKNAGLRNEWTVKAGEELYAPWTQLVSTPRMEKEIENSLGGLEVQHCGWVDFPGIVAAMTARIGQHENGRLIAGELDYDQVRPQEGIMQIAGETISFDEIVFSEGIRLLQNPFFEGMPLRPLKGQLLEIEIPRFEPGCIVAGKVFLLPQGEARFLCGSTYELTFDHDQPEPLGREEIEYSLLGTLKLPWKVTGHRAGIRPTTPDRRPLLGTHFFHRNVHIINGLGAKGVLHSPWCTRQLTEIITGNLPEIERECSLDRYTYKLRNLIEE
jgi:glycine oxidase